MTKLIKIRTIILGVLLLLAVIANAQQEKVVAVVAFLQENNLDSAKANINAAIVHPETANDAEVWYYRGFVYEEIYKKIEKDDNQSPARIEALYSFKKSLSLNPDKETFAEDIKNIKWLVNSLRNNWVECLNPAEYKIAIKLFEKYIEYSKVINPSPEIIQAKEIEFYSAIAKVYYEIVENTNEALAADTGNVAAKKDNLKFLALTKKEYSKILSMDPDNLFANYHMAILYYNQAVNIIKGSDYDIDLSLFAIAQDKSATLSMESLPFMEKAYNLDPTRIATLEGLTGIFMILHEEKKYNIFKQKLEDIKKPK